MDVAAFLAVSLLILAAVAGWVLTLVGLPGNWLMAAAACLYAWLGPAGSVVEIRWQTVAILIGLATAGEVLEAIAGAWGARRAGGSRRAGWYSLAGSFAGALLGASVGLPLPVIGSVAGAVIGGAIGAMAGAMLAEYSLGLEHRHTWSVGRSAFWGRLLGVCGKIAVSSVMVVALVAALVA